MSFVSPGMQQTLSNLNSQYTFDPSSASLPTDNSTTSDGVNPQHLFYNSTFFNNNNDILDQDSSSIYFNDVY